MKQTRPAFTHDALLQTVKKAFEDGLKAEGIKDKPDTSFSNIDCMMAGLAVFTFKFIVKDCLASNAPHITELTEHNMRYILGCSEGDHAYLADWVNAMDGEDAPSFKETIGGVAHEYEYFKKVPLNGSKNAPLVTVIRYKETKKKAKKGEEKTTKWMWVTDLEVTSQNIREIVKGARARHHIENQTFNTLKNQGYEFEHNFGHGTQYLNHVFSMLMMLAFLIDQCLQRLNKRFQEALQHCFGKKSLWERMLHSLYTYEFIPNFETLYEAIVRPPPKSSFCHLKQQNSS